MKKRGRACAVAAALTLAAAALALVVAAGAGAASEVAGCAVFPQPPAGTPANAPSLPTQAAWNQDVSKAPRAANSAAMIAYINAHGDDFIHPDFGSPRTYGFPVETVGPGQRKLPVHYTAYGSESSKGPFAVPGGARIEGGNHSNDDRHAIAVQRGSCRLFELYRAFFHGSPKPHWNADSGVEWNLGSAAIRPEGWTSADAAGLPIYPGLVRYDEVTAGHLEHALRVTVESSRSAYVHPAVHCAGDTGSGAAPAMGTRLRLRADYDLGGMHGAALVIAEAMKHYGLIVADNGSNWDISGETDHRWNDEDLDQLKRIPGSAFEVVRSAAAVHPC